MSDCFLCSCEHVEFRLEELKAEELAHLEWATRHLESITGDSGLATNWGVSGE